jgi:hypothetical protein
MIYKTSDDVSKASTALHGKNSSMSFSTAAACRTSHRCLSASLSRRSASLCPGRRGTHYWRAAAGLISCISVFFQISNFYTENLFNTKSYKNKQTPFMKSLHHAARPPRALRWGKP